MKIRCRSFALALAVAGPVFAQAPAPTSGAASTVVYVGGNDLVLKSSEGKLLNFTVPADYKFTVERKQLPLAALKPGTKLSAPVAPGSEAKLVASVAVVKGKVSLVAPPDAVSLAVAGATKELSVPAGTTFMVGGKALTIADLKADMMVEATIVTVADAASPEIATSAPPATPPMAGALLIAKAAEDEADLPAAGTSLPLLGTLGVVLLSIGFAILAVTPRLRRS